MLVSVYCPLSVLCLFVYLCVYVSVYVCICVCTSIRVLVKKQLCQASVLDALLHETHVKVLLEIRYKSVDPYYQ